MHGFVPDRRPIYLHDRSTRNIQTCSRASASVFEALPLTSRAVKVASAKALHVAATLVQTTHSQHCLTSGAHSLRQTPTSPIHLVRGWFAFIITIC